MDIGGPNLCMQRPFIAEIAFRIRKRHNTSLIESDILVLESRNSRDHVIRDIRGRDSF